MLSLFALAFGLGLVLNAAPGPVFAETVRQGTRGGFRLALGVQLGSLVGDAVWALVGLSSVGLLLRLEPLRVPIGIVGIAYLLWLAWDAWRSARHEFSVAADVRVDHRRALRAGLLLSITNPQHLAYWAAIGTALGTLGVATPTTAHYAIFFAGFMASSVVWAFSLSLLVDRVVRRLGLRWARLTYRACAIALLALAVSMIRELWLSHQRLPAASARPAVASRP